LVERALAETGLSYAILRPAIVFGGDGVLINNIAWLLRRVPVFAVGGRGDCRIRGIHIDDLANLAVDVAARRDDVIVDAVGPERPTFVELVTSIRAAIGSRARVVRVPGAVVPVAAKCLNALLRDVLHTPDEYHSMADNLADSTAPSTGTTKLSDWLTDNADTLGRHYANELQRHFRH
jgi:NADH dehydrogenase